jgi:hypothetical protein
MFLVQGNGKEPWARRSFTAEYMVDIVVITEKIIQFHDDSRGTYGSPACMPTFADATAIAVRSDGVVRICAAGSAQRRAVEEATTFPGPGREDRQVLRGTYIQHEYKKAMLLSWSVVLVGPMPPPR